MKRGLAMVRFSVDRPYLVTAVMVVAAAALAAGAALPTLLPQAVPWLPAARVDTDPENMLRDDEPVRVFHDRMKETLRLHDMVVVGIVNEEAPHGVFNPGTLGRIYELTKAAKGLRWPDPEDPGKSVGVVGVDVIAPSTVDNIEQEGLGTIRFEWLMPRPPETEAEALAVRDKAMRIPFLDGTLVSEDGRAIALYLPLTNKDQSHRVYEAVRELTADWPAADQVHITGLPVAEDTFGVEMFKQMAISAPLAMVVIFLLMLVFFRKLVLIVSPMVVAMVSVVMTMGLLILTGQTIHIMSSMIPIFIMPIAVLDAVHILSEFFDRYEADRPRREVVMDVMRTLFSPMLFTSLTTAAGFASLALTPIPPVQVFGLYIAFGVLVAWVATVTFIPAYIMMIPAGWLRNFGLKREGEEAHSKTLVSRALRAVGRGTYRYAFLILAGTAVMAAVAGYGISRIRINDNPTRWFEPDHPIREADRVLNAHFGGTYMAYLAFQADTPTTVTPAYVADLESRLRAKGESLAEDYPRAPKAFNELAEAVPAAAAEVGKGAEKQALVAKLREAAGSKLAAADGDAWDAWNEADLYLSAESQRDETFKDPEALEYIAALQDHLLTTGVVGKSNSLTDIVRTVYRELMEGNPEYFRVPDTPQGVAQTLIQYQSSHRPQDLDHFVTPDYRTSSLWIQLTSGDNRDMQRVVDAGRQWMAENPPPMPLRADWFGLTYINVVWQDKMVWGMAQAFLGSFLVVLLMMIILFRSAMWGMLSMIPLTVTVGMIYGVVGLVGKDYDMPTAVLSSLSLGLAVDYAIHFLARSREARDQAGSWRAAVPHVFGEPARAIFRNVIVIGMGFLPLLAAPLVPYQTVGIFMASILVLAGVATLLILPALVRVMEPLLFPKTRVCCWTCNSATCIVTSVAAVALVAVNVHQFLEVGVTSLVWVSLPALGVLAGLCGLASYREKCRLDAERRAAAQSGESSEAAEAAPATVKGDVR